jgi:predicted MFS family arabinose efflux permease
MLVAVTEMIGMLGAALGQEILGFVVQSTGWRAGMLLCAGFGIVVLTMTFLFVHDAPNGSAARLAAPCPPPLRERLRALLAPSLILAGLIGGMIYSAALSFAMLWGVPFFIAHLGLDLATASLCASFFSWGMIIGMLAFGWACGRLASPIALLGLGSLLTGASIAVILYGPPTFTVASLGMFFCGLASGSYALVFVIVKGEVPPEDAGPAFALANMLIIAVGGLILQPLIGILSDAGHPVTDPASLSILLWVQGLGLILLLPLAGSLRAPGRSPPVPRQFGGAAS